jgi:DNA-binding transcriptional regulator LsrR (DeoR family)
MYRRDIADYLGLTIESVSRALSMLRDGGILGFKSQTQREIVLLDRSKLAQLADQLAQREYFMDSGLPPRWLSHRSRASIQPLA